MIPLNTVEETSAERNTSKFKSYGNMQKDFLKGNLSSYLEYKLVNYREIRNLPSGGNMQHD